MVEGALGAARRRAAATWSRRLVQPRADLDLHPTARLGRVEVAGRGRRGHLVLGAGSVVQDGVVLQISDGGVVEVGPGCTIRRGAVLNVSGHLRLLGGNLVSWYSVLHCASSVVLEELAGTAERVTVVDSSHVHGAPGAPDEHWRHNHVVGDVVVGRNTWLAAGCTVTAGARIGAGCTVAAGAVVLGGDHPAGSTLAGAPARVVGRAAPAR